MNGIGVVSGWLECNGLVRFGRWVVWVTLGWKCLVDGWFGVALGWFWVVLLAGLMESKGLGWYWVGLGGKCVVWDSTRLVWVVFGWFVMVNGLGGTGPSWM